MITESICLKGNLEVVLYDKDSKIKDLRQIKNLVVAVGKDYIASRMLGNSNVVMSHMAVGNANVVPTTSDTTLGGEEARVVLDSSGLVSNVVTYTATFPAGTGTGTLAEAGVFNDSTKDSGTMLCRTRFNEINKAADDVIVITWNITVE